MNIHTQKNKSNTKSYRGGSPGPVHVSMHATVTPGGRLQK